MWYANWNNANWSPGNYSHIILISLIILFKFTLLVLIWIETYCLHGMQCLRKSMSTIVESITIRIITLISAVTFLSVFCHTLCISMYLLFFVSIDWSMIGIRNNNSSNTQMHYITMQFCVTKVCSAGSDILVIIDLSSQCH